MAYSACIGPYSGPGCREERGGGLDLFSGAEVCGVWGILLSDTKFEIFYFQGSQFVSVFLAVAFIFAQIII